MRTIDFLPQEAFDGHLERRRTPRRATILCGFAIICLGFSQMFAWDSQGLQEQAFIAEQPDEDALVAGARLNQIYREMSDYSNRLDPLCEHLASPTTGWLLAGLAEAAGNDVIIQKIDWNFNDKHTNRFGQLDPQLDLVVTCVVNGDLALIELPRKLRDFSGYQSATTGKVEIVKGNDDALRVDIMLNGNNVLLTKEEIQ